MGVLFSIVCNKFHCLYDLHCIIPGNFEISHYECVECETFYFCNCVLHACSPKWRLIYTFLLCTSYYLFYFLCDCYFLQSCFFSRCIYFFFNFLSSVAVFLIFIFLLYLCISPFYISLYLNYVCDIISPGQTCFLLQRRVFSYKES